MKRFLRHARHWLLLVVCLGALGAYLAYNLHGEHERVEATERERLATQSKVIEDNLSRQLVAINLALESIMVELPDWAGRPDGRELVSRRLKSMEVSMPSVRTFAVLDEKGTVTASNREELLGRNFHDRDYFQTALRAPSTKTLYVSAPFKTVLDTFVISVARVITGPQGQFAGLVSASVDPVDMQILLNSVRYADDMRSMLVHGDGTIFVSQPALVDVVGKNLSVAGSFFRQHLESKRPVSYFEGKAITTGDKRLPVLRTIQPADLTMDKPLVVSVSRGWDAMFAPWQRDVRNQLLVYALFGLLCMAGLIIYQRQRVQQRVINQRLKLATEATGVGIWEFDLKTRRYHWDLAMFDLFGLNPQTVNALNNDWQQLLLPGELLRMKDATRVTIKQGQAFDLTFQIRRQDGQVRFMRNRAVLYNDGSHAPSRLIGTTEDVTERKLREADLRVAATAFECQESIMVTDANQLILRVNRAFTELFGYTAQDVLGATPRVLQSGRHDPAFYAAMWDGITRGGAWQGEIWDRRKNGECFPVWLSITVVCGDDGGVSHYVATHTDITLRKAAEDDIRQLAFYDPLTGLPNRRLLQDRLHQAMSQARRERGRVALLFLDLDKFKPVNDAFGHQAGDELLQAVAQRLQACVRESDTVARLGGDEFVLLLPSIEAAQDAMAVAEKIHQAFGRPFALSAGRNATMSFSTGIAVYPEHASDEKALMRHADEAMYQAKAAGRDRFVLFAPAPEPATLLTPADSGGTAPTIG
ncbi:diguanylate cyclase [Rhodoferax ferrireducens]|uniref:bifunctional diguanylate cyclase/phosphodiesterase n=1 Tax=Rhodoferax ferrireducens TaxID=192843 RepID=UPI00298E3D3D|nr:diguanylate cyclase [Rhodoferax ferrireducens]WPC66392.1 diguanylate cyclase [Rhodoferax ferrireducens]